MPRDAWGRPDDHPEAGLPPGTLELPDRERMALDALDEGEGVGASLFPRGAAVLSACGRYRYRLTRTIGTGRRSICWIMLNPSIADADIDDPTMRKVIGFSTRWGYDRIAVVNLFAWRATKPRELRLADDPVGPENDSHIGMAVIDADMVVAAWGTERPSPIAERAFHVARRLLAAVDLHVIELTKYGSPRHPLMPAYTVAPVAWAMEER